MKLDIFNRPMPQSKPKPFSLSEELDKLWLQLTYKTQPHCVWVNGVWYDLVDGKYVERDSSGNLQ